MWENMGADDFFMFERLVCLSKGLEQLPCLRCQMSKYLPYCSNCFLSQSRLFCEPLVHVRALLALERDGQAVVGPGEGGGAEAAAGVVVVEGRVEGEAVAVARAVELAKVAEGKKSSKKTCLINAQTPVGPLTSRSCSSSACRRSSARGRPTCAPWRGGCPR